MRDVLSGGDDAFENFFHCCATQVDTVGTVDRGTSVRGAVIELSVALDEPRVCGS